MPFVKAVHDHVGSREDKFYKTTLFRSDALLLGLNCLEPGQIQQPHDHAGQADGLTFPLVVYPAKPVSGAWLPLGLVILAFLVAPVRAQEPPPAESTDDAMTMSEDEQELFALWNEYRELIAAEQWEVALDVEVHDQPGLVADRYGATVVVKVYSHAWLPHLGAVLDALVERDVEVDG